MPATARTSPVDGSIATIPPYWPPSAVTAACWIAGETELRTGGAARGGTDASTRSPASSSPPGDPLRRSSSASSTPLTPTVASLGTPSASSAARREAGMLPTLPTTELPTVPSGALRESDSRLF